LRLSFCIPLELFTYPRFRIADQGPINYNACKIDFSLYFFQFRSWRNTGYASDDLSKLSLLREWTYKPTLFSGKVSTGKEIVELSKLPQVDGFFVEQLDPIFVDIVNANRLG
jgi:hypothetical protein